MFTLENCTALLPRSPFLIALVELFRVSVRCVAVILLVAIGMPAFAADDYLDPTAAFKFSAVMQDPKTVAITYAIADGYYMYRERFQITAQGAALGTPVFPNGKIKFDETFKKNVETYRHAVTIKVPVDASGAFMLSVTGQGCADQGLCYAPMTSQVQLSPKGGGAVAAIASAAPPENVSNAVPPGAAQEGAITELKAELKTPGADGDRDSESGRIQTALQSGKIGAIIPLFLLLGLALSFTPCVLPMVPILSSIIVGEGAAITRGRGFLLSVTYALGMAIVYTALGVAAGLLGEGLAAALQNPWVLTAFALLMVVLSLSMFGFYELQLPSAMQARLAQFSQRQQAGKMVGVFIMGALSALIVGPCVAAPLAGALVYISQTRNVVIGGTALFSMAIGMSVPLLLVGISAGSLLPRAGVWMDTVKRLFGVLMLGVAWWMVSPVLPVPVQMAGWAALGIGYGAYLLWSTSAGWIFKAIGLAVVTLGLLQLVGVATGARDVLTPLAQFGGPRTPPLAFIRVKSTAQLDTILANTGGRPVLLDFYADWCVSCKEMEKFTFSEPDIRQKLGQTLLLQVDVTANDADDKAMLKRFQLFGPPGIILFDKQGQEIQGRRVIGYQDPKRFARSLDALPST